MPGNTTLYHPGAQQTMLVPVMRYSVGSISKGEALYVVGFDTANQLFLVDKAKANAIATMPSLGLAFDDFSNTVSGSAIISGNLPGINTSDWTVGTDLYISAATAGALTSTKPAGTTSVVEKVGLVVYAHSTDGIIQIYNYGSLVHPDSEGGSLHSAVSQSTAGFMSAADKTKLDGVPKNNSASATPTVNDDSVDGYSIGSRWVNVATDKEFVCTDATEAAALWKETTYDLSISGLTEDTSPDSNSDYVATYDTSASTHKKVLLNKLLTQVLAAVQIRANSGTQTLTNSYADVTYGTKDIETNSSVLSTDNSVITVNETGTYLISYSMTVSCGTASGARFQVTVNDTELPGSVSGRIGNTPCGVGATNRYPVDINVLATLSVNDVVKVRCKRDVGSATTIIDANRTFKIVKLDGMRGPKGDDGDLVWKGAWNSGTTYNLNECVIQGGTSYVCILQHSNHQPPNGTYWDVLASQGSAATKIDNYSFFGTNPYIVQMGTSYVVKANILFRGSSVLGTPSSIKIIKSINSSGTGYLKIYDVTNGNAICETSFTNTTKDIATISSLSNISSGEAVWEIQLKSSAAQIETQLSCVSIVWS